MHMKGYICKYLTLVNSNSICNGIFDDKSVFDVPEKNCSASLRSSSYKTDTAKNGDKNA